MNGYSLAVSSHSADQKSLCSYETHRLLTTFTKHHHQTYSEPIWSCPQPSHMSFLKKYFNNILSVFLIPVARMATAPAAHPWSCASHQVMQSRAPSLQCFHAPLGTQTPVQSEYQWAIECLTNQPKINRSTRKPFCSNKLNLSSVPKMRQSFSTKENCRKN